MTQKKTLLLYSKLLAQRSTKALTYVLNVRTYTNMMCCFVYILHLKRKKSCECYLSNINLNYRFFAHSGQKKRKKG